ncbi:MAG: GNAT family N-acetyltransferase [Lachnospiraceae bacterium]|nr:GNAT family N-acetyltransferase [Lachnospiraceae bacterium]
MRTRLLRAIYYVTIDHFVPIPQELIADLAYHGIKIFQVPYHSIEKFLPPKNMTPQNCLILCDVPELAHAFLNAGYYVVAIFHRDNKDAHFSIRYALEDFTEVDWHYFIKYWQRYADIPWHVMDTERCKIREMCPDDLNDLYDLYKDKRICQYTEDLFENRMHELDYIKDYVKNMYHFYGFGTWLIEDKFSGNLIGRVGFNYRPGFEDPELGFVIDPKQWRRGYAYETCSASIEYGKKEHGFKRIHSFVRIENEPSIALLDKLGFRECGRYTINEQLHERWVLEL